MIVKGLQIRHNDVNEITQLIMIKLWKKLPEFNYDSKQGYFRGCLRTIVINTVRNFVVTKQDKRTYNNSTYDGVNEDESSGAFSESYIEKIAVEEWEKYIFVYGLEEYST